MSELRRYNREYVQRLQELSRAYRDLRLGLVPSSQEDLEAAEKAFYAWKWLPAYQDEPPNHPLWRTNVTLARRCAELDAGMTSSESDRAYLYATDMTGVYGAQDFPERTFLSDEKERHHYLCAWLVAAMRDVQL